MRGVLLRMLEVAEGERCLLEVLEVATCAPYAGGRGRRALFAGGAGGDALYATPMPDAVESCGLSFALRNFAVAVFSLQVPHYSGKPTSRPARANDSATAVPPKASENATVHHRSWTSVQQRKLESNRDSFPC